MAWQEIRARYKETVAGNQCKSVPIGGDRRAKRGSQPSSLDRLALNGDGSLPGNFSPIFHSISGTFIFTSGLSGFGRGEGEKRLPSFSDILSISRGIFKWPGQQQVVNPFFKGFAWHRGEEGNSFGRVFPSFSREYREDPPPPPFSLSSRRQHRLADHRTFSNHAISNPPPTA